MWQVNQLARAILTAEIAQGVTHRLERQTRANYAVAQSMTLALTSTTVMQYGPQISLASLTVWAVTSKLLDVFSPVKLIRKTKRTGLHAIVTRNTAITLLHGWKMEKAIPVGASGGTRHRNVVAMSPIVIMRMKPIKQATDCVTI